MPRLAAPSARLYQSWRAAHEEWGPGEHEDGFGLRPSDDVSSPEGFAEWVAGLNDAEAEQRCTYRWIVEGDRVLGGIALRHGWTEYVQWAGHIGYGISPSARRHGLGTWALAQMLNCARDLGMDRVLLVCEPDNRASAATIERNGGVLEGTPEGGLEGALEDTPEGTPEGTPDNVHDHGRRYWIELR